MYNVYRNEIFKKKHLNLKKKNPKQQEHIK